MLHPSAHGFRQKLALILVLAIAATFGGSATPAEAASGPSVADYAQCANGDASTSSFVCLQGWVNGILNNSNSHYREGQVTPQRLMVDHPSKTGTTHSIRLRYQARKGTIHSYDSLAGWNVTQTGLNDTAASRCAGLSGACPSAPSSTFPIPADNTSVTPGADPVSSHHDLPDAQRFLKMFGGTITAVDAITHDNATGSGDDYATMTIRYTIPSAPGRVQLLFGGHLAVGQGTDGWGAGIGSSSISGGPYHIKVDAIDRTSVGNRDNQIMGSAILAEPNASIVKTASAVTVDAGQNVGYTITVTANGSGDSGNVVVTDVLPNGLTWTATPPSGATCSPANPVAGGTTLTCNLGTIAQGTSKSITLSAPTTAANCGTISNTATVSSNGDTNPGDNSSGPITISIRCSPDPFVVKTASTPTVNAGDTATYVVTVTGGGTGDATNVVMNDTLPAGLSWTVTPGAGVTCTPSTNPVAGGTALSCNMGTIANGTSKTVTLSATTSGAQCAAGIDNTATITATSDASTSNNSSGPIHITVNCSPDPFVVKTTSTSTVNAGGTASYLVTVSASGTGDSTNVVMNDTLPAGLSWTVTPGAGVTCTPSTNPVAGGTALSCNMGTIANGTSKTVTLSATTSGAQCAAGIDNTATITATTDTGTGNNSSGPVHIAVTCPDVTVSKAAADPTFDAGGVASYSVSVSAAGSGTLNTVTVNDTLPAGLTWTVTPAAGVTCTPSGSGIAGGTAVSCNAGSLSGGTTKPVVTVSATTSAANCANGIDNTATVTAVGDTNAGNNSSGPIHITVNCPDVTIFKTTQTPTVNAGDAISFDLRVRNLGPGTATAVTVTDTLPSGLNWTVSPGAGATCTPNNPVGGGTTLTCTIASLVPSLAPGFTNDVVIRLDAQTSQSNCGTISNSASVSAANEPQSATGNNTAGPVTITVNCVVLHVDKAVCEEAAVPGGFLTYTITYGNSGAAPALGAILTDTLPVGVTATSQTDGGVVSGNTITWSIGGIPAVSGGTKTFVVAVSQSATGPLHNLAVLSATNGETKEAHTYTPVSKSDATASGKAYAVDIDAHTTIIPDVTVHEFNAQTSSASVASPGPDQRGAVFLDTPAVVSGVVSARVIEDNSRSEVDDSTSTSFDTIANVSILGGAITSSTIHAVSQSTAGALGSSFGSTGSHFENLVVMGASGPVAMGDVAPNTLIQVRNPLDPADVIGTAVLYEEVGATGSTEGMWSANHTVNMIHVTLLKPFAGLPANAEIIVSHADSQADYAIGLACGTHPNTVSAEAFTAYASGQALGTPPGQVSTARYADAVIDPNGNSASTHLDNVSVPGVLSTGTTDNTACGWAFGPAACTPPLGTTPPYATSRSITHTVNILGGLITADAVDVSSTSSIGTGGGTTTYGVTFTHLVLNTAGSPPVVIDGTPLPNSGYVLTTSSGDYVVVLLNEQTPTINGPNDTSGTVNAIRVAIYSSTGALKGEIIVGSAHSDAHKG